jgi:hypothetical protein
MVIRKVKMTEMTKAEHDAFGKDRMNHWYQHCRKHGDMAMSWHQFKIVYSHGLDAVEAYNPERKLKND